MERVVQLAAHFNVPTMVCVNKFDIKPDLTRAIEKQARESRSGHLEAGFTAA